MAKCGAVATVNSVSVQQKPRAAPTGARVGGSKKSNKHKCSKASDFPTACDVRGPAVESTDSKPPSLLRVAGAEWHKSAEDERYEDYDYLPARCDDETPLGLSAEEYEELNALCGSSALEEEHPMMRQAVLVRGLPNELCAEPWIRVLIDQAGFKHQVVDYRCLPGSSCGELLLWLTSQSLLDYAVWHFQGCCWTKDIQVTACIVKTVPMPPSCAEIETAWTEKVLEVLLAPPEEWAMYEGRCMLAEPVMYAILVAPEQQFVDCSQSPPEFTMQSDANQRLSTIWEEEKRSEFTSTEVSTESGASGTPVHSETEESHEGDES